VRILVRALLAAPPTKTSFHKNAMKKQIMDEYTQEIEVNNQEEALNLFGPGDRHLRAIERAMGVRCVLRGNRLQIIGEEHAVAMTADVLMKLLDRARGGTRIEMSDINFGLMLIEDNAAKSSGDLDLREVMFDSQGRGVRAKSPVQSAYLRAMLKNDLVICIGPAGTGKTYLAVAAAIRKLNCEQVSRIVVCRPAVEAGEKLGFLPGDFQQKVDPYLRPIYDAMFSLLGPEKSARLLERNIVEVAPLAYMRGRTLDDAFVIMDEAQNTTIEQMKMLLTRLGRRSCAVVTGDVTQVDLPPDKVSGLIDASERLKGIEGIGFIYFTRKDVVRHDLVGRIIEAYEERAGREDNGTGGDNG